MNIIIITEKDAANISLAKIVAAFLKKEAKIRLYAPFFADSTLKYFEKSIPKYDINSLTEKDVEWCNIIFCSTLSSIYLPEFVFRAHTPIFTHNYLMNRQINWGGDISFVPSKATVASDYDEYLYYSYIGIGEPKYDRSEELDIHDSNSQKLLFIDSGHYPFSYEGKKELANTLINICNKYPDYELVIKPRFLPEDSVVTHRNNIHLYDLIKELAGDNIPSNLTMLHVYRDLQELIEESMTVICMYTTAFVGAVASGKGLIILDNLPSEDIYDIRHKTYMRCRENMMKSGAVIDYRKIDSILPYGVKSSSEYVSYLLDETNDVADKIVETCEYLWKNFYSIGKFPKLSDSTYKEYKHSYCEDLDMSWEIKVSQRFHDFIFLKSLILIDFHLSNKLNINYLLNKINCFKNENGIITEEAFRVFLRKINDIRDHCIMDNKEILLKDKIDAGVYLNACYLQRKYDEIIDFSNKDISAYDLYRAFVADDLNEDSCVIKDRLVSYFNKCISREWAKEISDMPNNKFRAFEMLIRILIDEKAVEEVSYYIAHMKSYYMNIYLLREFENQFSDEIQKSRYSFIIETFRWIEDFIYD